MSIVDLKPTKAIKILRSIRYQFELSLTEVENPLVLDVSAKIMHEATTDAEKDNIEAMQAIDMAIKAIKETAKCERCNRAKAVEFSESTNICYCKRCYRAVTDAKTPY